MTIRKELTSKDLMIIEQEALKEFEKKLRSWGFDTNHEMFVWDDPITGNRVIIQEETNK